jgi:hypothetical protein
MSKANFNLVMEALRGKLAAQRILKQLQDGHVKADSVSQGELAEVRKALLSFGFTIRRMTSGNAAYFSVEPLQGPMLRPARRRAKRSAHPHKNLVEHSKGVTGVQA